MEETNFKPSIIEISSREHPTNMKFSLAKRLRALIPARVTSRYKQLRCRIHRARIAFADATRMEFYDLLENQHTPSDEDFYNRK
uniref:Uncharacterized protein n=1 Tax=Panagrellus redivivus TaxID=6233 RepID=A0A7E4V2T7_PANRE